MTNVEIRNFAYDTIAIYLLENHPRFGLSFYDSMRAGNTIESAVESYLKENYADLGNVTSPLKKMARAWHATFSEKYKIFSLSCDIVADCIGVEHLFDIESLEMFTSTRANYTLGFITSEECANMIVDEICKHLQAPSIHTIDLVLSFVGMPRYFDCVDTRNIHITR